MHQLSIRHRAGMLLHLRLLKRTQNRRNQRRLNRGVQRKERRSHRELTARLTLSAAAARHIRQGQSDSALSRHIRTQDKTHTAGLRTNLLRSQALLQGRIL